MDIRNCRKCGRIFQYSGEGPVICDNCKREQEKLFEQVRDYIRDNPGASMNQVSEENSVSINQIQQWVREERLEFSRESGVTFYCEKCGAPIRTGRFCNNCKNAMAQDLDSMYKKPVTAVPHKRRTERDAMRFMGKQDI
ncbi:MAG: flagellar protein [Lachnospiraceae bacterium]|nr:flagellar protein [Lachnospiraceae bacterium]MDY6352420.1 flagellar protein [Lachnospiraceae bacterium]